MGCLSDAHASALANAIAAAIPVMLRVIVCSPLRVRKSRF